MIRSNTPWQTLANAEVNWTSENLPYSDHFKDVYYSPQNGLKESQYVFLQGNQLPERWTSHPHPSFHIVETGFGTGLNFLLTWKLWRDQPQPRPQLHFVSIEKFPLTKKNLCKALAAWPELENLAAILLENYPEAIAGQHRLILDNGAVTLDLWWEDAEDALSELASYQHTNIDAWYLDGFAPSRNQEMWTTNIFHSMADNCRAGASFATFTAAGDVRRGLLDAGFHVSKLPGFGKKRECLHGTLDPTHRAETSNFHAKTGVTPWDIRGAQPPVPQSAIVIGAGIAGCSVAAALARRGIPVTILESDQVANAGSGNDQGVLYTRLSQKHSPLSDFSLLSYSYAVRFYQQLFTSGLLQEGQDGDLCGVFHQSDKIGEMEAMSALLQSVPDLARILSAPEANKVLGITQSKGGYWYPRSGWMRPPAVCQALLQNTAIQLTEQTGAVALKRLNGGWAALSGDRILAEAECVVVAAGTTSGALAGLDWLPLKAIRGQTSTIPATDNTAALRAAMCHKGYISPQRLGSHCIGATFDTLDPDASLRPHDHRKNLDTLGEAIPDWQAELLQLDECHLHGRVGYRCASPDYLPLIGPAPDRESFVQTYASLSKNARRVIPSTADFVPGLYLSTGHGSRGLTSAPLAAEIIASELCNEPAPLSRELYRAVSPARFIIRDLKRKQI